MNPALSPLQATLFPKLSYGRPLLTFGHYANVLELDHDLGLAFSIDGVGTKGIVAHQLGIYDTIGIDCVAMTVNDLLCVGATPTSMVDYLAIAEPDNWMCNEIFKGLAKGAEIAGISISGGETAIIPEIVNGFDLAGAGVGMVNQNRIITGKDMKPDDVIYGIPSAGLHANGYTVARKVLKKHWHYNEFVPLLDQTLGGALLEPTRIYTAEIAELNKTTIRPRGLFHITGGGFSNLLRINSNVGFTITSLPPIPPIFMLIQELSNLTKQEMFYTFNMGIGFCIIVHPEDASWLETTLPTAWNIGRVTDVPGGLDISRAMM